MSPPEAGTSPKLDGLFVPNFGSYSADGNRGYAEQSQEAGRLTSFWPGEAFVQVEHDFVHKVLDVAVLRTPNKHHPVVGEALHRGFLPHLGAVTEFQLHLDRTLRQRATKRSWSGRQTERISPFGSDLDLKSLRPTCSPSQKTWL